MNLYTLGSIKFNDLEISIVYSEIFISGDAVSCKIHTLEPLAGEWFCVCEQNYKIALNALRQEIENASQRLQ